MARTGISDGSELELLLDTITNTFGGILFVALLVALLANRASIQQRSVVIWETESDTSEHLLELSTLNLQIDKLTKILDIQQSASAISPPEARPAEADVLRQLMDERQQLTETRRAERRQNEELSNRISNAAQSATKIRESIAAAKNELAANLAIEKATVESKTESRLPLAKRTSKTEVQLVMRYGKLYALYDYSVSSRTVNTTDMVVTESDATSATLAPNPIAGVATKSLPELRLGLKQRLQNKSPSQHYLAICVWEDSFDQFLSVKDLVIELGYRYRLVLCSEGDAVSMGYTVDARAQ